MSRKFDKGAFLSHVPEPARELPLVEEAPDAAPEVMVGVVLTRCPVVSYNKYSNILVYERDGQLIQTNAILDYDGSGFVEVE